MNRNKLTSFTEKELQNRLVSTKDRMSNHKGAFREVLQGEVDQIQDVLDTKEFAAFKGAGYAESKAAKLSSKEHAERIARKLSS